MRYILVSLLATTAIPFSAFAQDAVELDEVLLSGGLSPVGVEQTGRAFTVLTGEQLEARGTRTVADALRQVPGLAVSRTGAIGGLTQIRVRGAEANHVLVLIDGVEVAPAGFGELDFGGVQMSDIERIEILRGPQSSVFGSNAAAGVISITTRGGLRNDFAAGGSIEGSSDRGALVSGHIRGGRERWDGALSVSLRDVEGFNIATGTGDREGEREGDQNLTLNAKGNLDVTDNLSVGGVFRFVDRETETDFASFPLPPDPPPGLIVDTDAGSEARDVSLAFFAKHSALNDSLLSELRFEYVDTALDFLSDGAVTSTNDSRRFKGLAKSSYAFDLGSAHNVVTAAIEVEEEVFDAFGEDDIFGVFLDVDASRTLLGFIGEYQGTFFDKIDLQAGVRYDSNDAFEDAVTFSVGTSYRHEQTGTRLHSSVGRGVVNPDFFQQFGSTPDSFIGNPDLLPEETFQWDIGVEQVLWDDRLIFDVTYFRGNVDNEINDADTPIPGVSTVVNDPGESPRQGVELSLSATPFDPLTLTASYTYTLSDDSEGILETRRPRHLASFDAIYSFLNDRATLNLGVIYNGAQTDLDFNSFPAPTETLDDFVLVNVQGTYQADENIQVFARIENLTNADYQEVLGFETQGITGFAGLRATF